MTFWFADFDDSVDSADFADFADSADFADFSDFADSSDSEKKILIPLILHCHNSFMIFHLSRIEAEMLRIYIVDWIGNLCVHRFYNYS